MADIHQHPELYVYVLLKQDENVGSFLSNFLAACLAADPDNFEILKPALEQIQEKYPLRTKIEIGKSLLTGEPIVIVGGTRVCTAVNSNWTEMIRQALECLQDKVKKLETAGPVQAQDNENLL